MATKDKIVAIVSGGLDSTTMLYHAIGEGLDVDVLSFNYGQKHSRELDFAKITCKALGLVHNIVDLQAIGKQLLSNSALINESVAVPNGHYSDDSMRATVVPNRNMIMLALAIGYAENIGAKAVYIGSHLGDRAQYPDCRVEFTEALNVASQIGTYNHVQVVSPFNRLTKSDIVKIGLRLNVLYENTWSCYEGGNEPCLNCGTCVERTEAFIINNVVDPLVGSRWNEAVMAVNIHTANRK